MKIKDSYSEIIRFTQEQVINFSAITGDYNPIHLDDSFAAETKFGKKIIHGLLSSSVFSKIIGMDFPGKGSVYLSQTLKFLQPMYVDTDYIAYVEITEIIPEKYRFVLKTQIKDAITMDLTIDGQALVLFKE